ncbi:unnamed protein product [Boreogadus saida]
MRPAPGEHRLGLPLRNQIHFIKLPDVMPNPPLLSAAPSRQRPETWGPGAPRRGDHRPPDMRATCPPDLGSGTQDMGSGGPSCEDWGPKRGEPGGQDVGIKSPEKQGPLASDLRTVGPRRWEQLPMT